MDGIPSLPPPIILGYHHLSGDTRWRVWGGACVHAHCGLRDAVSGRGSCALTLDCPAWARAGCTFQEERDHPPVRGAVGVGEGTAAHRPRVACMHVAFAALRPTPPCRARCPQESYASKIKACMPNGALTPECVAAL